MADRTDAERRLAPFRRARLPDVANQHHALGAGYRVGPELAVAVRPTSAIRSVRLAVSADEVEGGAGWKVNAGELHPQPGRAGRSDGRGPHEAAVVGSLQNAARHGRSVFGQSHLLEARDQHGWDQLLHRADPQRPRSARYGLLQLRSLVAAERDTDPGPQVGRQVGGQRSVEALPCSRLLRHRRPVAHDFGASAVGGGTGPRCDTSQREAQPQRVTDE